MKINGLVIDQKENKNPLQFKNVTVWASSGLKLRAADAYIRNLTLEDLGTDAEKVPDGLEIGSTSSEVTEFGWFSENTEVTETVATSAGADITVGQSTSSEITQAGGTSSEVTEGGSINSEVTEAGGKSSEVTEFESTSSEVTEFESTSSEITKVGGTSSEETEVGNIDSEVTEVGGKSSEVTEVGSTNSAVTEAGSTSSEITEVGSIDSEVTKAGGTSAEVTSCQSFDLASTLQLFDFSSLTMAFVDIQDTQHKIEGVEDIPDMMLVDEVILVQCQDGEVFNDRDNNNRKRWFCMESGEILNKYSKNPKCLTLDQVECFVPTAQPSETTTSQIPNTVTTTETISNSPESTTPTTTTATSTTIKTATSTSSTKTSSTFTTRGKRV